MTRCIACPARAVHLHHVVTRQEIRRRGGDEGDPRNLIPLCLRCHGRHHSAFTRIPARLLPAGVRDFMEELMGPYAPDYLARYYPTGV